MYNVQCSFTNWFGSEFTWEFQVPSDDYRVATHQASWIFYSGLTAHERLEASETFRLEARHHCGGDCPACTKYKYEEQRLQRDRSVNQKVWLIRQDNYVQETPGHKR